MKKFLKPLLFLAGGALFGLAYYALFGCQGSCPISSNPWYTMAYMGVVGLLLSGIFPLPRKKT